MSNLSVIREQVAVVRMHARGGDAAIVEHVGLQAACIIQRSRDAAKERNNERVPSTFYFQLCAHVCNKNMQLSSLSSKLREERVLLKMSFLSPSIFACY